MKIFLIYICSLLAVLCQSINAYLPTSGKQTLLYYVTNEESLNTIDKMNKVSLLFNNLNCELILDTIYNIIFLFMILTWIIFLNR